MLNRKQNLLIYALIFLAMGLLLTSPVKAATTSTDATASTTQEALIKALQEQVKALQDQIQVLKSQLLTAQQGTNKTLKLMRVLKEGMRGNDVKLLQQILATDSSIYPEKIVSGYFGKLTTKAVKRFKEKFASTTNDIDNDINEGKISSSTLSKINEILEEGAGNSGKVPPGLLIAPGIMKKLGGLRPQPLPGQILPPGIAKKLGTTTQSTSTPPATSTPDTTSPVISQVIATSTTASSTWINWLTDESATSKIWYRTSTPVDTTASSTATVASSSALELSHSILLSGINASTTYYYRVSSTDSSGNTATSPADYSFTTTP